MSARSPLKYQYDGSLDLIGRKTGAYDKRTRSWSALKIAVNACSLGTSEVKPLAPLAHCHAAAMPSWAWNPLKVIAQKKAVPIRKLEPLLPRFKSMWTICP